MLTRRGFLNETAGAAGVLWTPRAGVGPPAAVGVAVS